MNDFGSPSSPPPIDNTPPVFSHEDPDGPLDIHRRDVSSVSAGDSGEAIDSGEGRIFPCEQCGADLRFHIGVQGMKCDFCGHVTQIELSPDAQIEEQDFEAMLRRLKAWREEAAQRRSAEDRGVAVDSSQQRQEVRCESCGGNVEFMGTLTSSACPYCGSPIQLEKAHKTAEHRIPVDGVLPFQIDRTIAKQNLDLWVQSRWFAPNEFRRRGAEGQFNGVYLSYFTFDSMTYTHYRGRRGEYYYVTVGTGKNKSRQRRTRWYPASGNFQRFFDDVLVLANTGLRRDLMLQLEPWPLLKVVPFNQQMLAGFLARTYDMELDTCFVDGKERIDRALYADVCNRIGGDTQQVDQINSQYQAITYKHLLLPVWLLAYRYKDRAYQVFINAATGEVNGERPWSLWKIGFTVLAVVAVAVAGFAFTQR